MSKEICVNGTIHSGEPWCMESVPARFGKGRLDFVKNTLTGHERSASYHCHPLLHHIMRTIPLALFFDLLAAVSYGWFLCERSNAAADC